MAPFSEGHSQTVQSAANDILSSYWPGSELPLPLPLFSPPCKRAGSHSIIAPPPPCEAVLPEDVHLLFLCLTDNHFSFFPSPQCIGWRRAPTLRMRQRETQPNSCLTEPMWQTPRSATALPFPPSLPPLTSLLLFPHSLHNSLRCVHCGILYLSFGKEVVVWCLVWWRRFNQKSRKLYFTHERTLLHTAWLQRGLCVNIYSVTDSCEVVGQKGEGRTVEDR